MTNKQIMTTRRLVLYIAGWTPRSERMAGTIRSVCEEVFPGDFEFDVVDVLEAPELAESAKVVATPTLVVERPSPSKRIIGEIGSVKLLKTALGVERSA